MQPTYQQKNKQILAYKITVFFFFGGGGGAFQKKGLSKFLDCSRVRGESGVLSTGIAVFRHLLSFSEISVQKEVPV